MESAYSGSAKIVTVIAGDFNTDPTDARFASEETFAMLREKFVWAWENVPLSERVTNPAKGRYPDACFDGFLVRGATKSLLQANPHPRSQRPFPGHSHRLSLASQSARQRESRIIQVLFDSHRPFLVCLR